MDLQYRKYRRTGIAEMRPYAPGEAMSGISVADVDKAAGSPKVGDMIARNPKDHGDQWLVAEKYFKDNFEPLPDTEGSDDDASLAAAAAAASAVLG